MLTESEKRAAASAESHSSSQTTLPPAATLEERANFPDAAKLLPGSQPEFRQLGQFRILRRLGEGGMGSVYLGYHAEQGRQVAIKVLADLLAQNQTYVKRFYREARNLALLDHPNIVQGISVGRDEPTGKYFMALEYVDGTSCQDLLERSGRLSVGDAVRIVLDIARALEHVHSRKIVHRDIKPDNILLTKSGVAKLADLGLAKRIDDLSHLTATRQSFGTPSYMPHEQALNASKADARSDIYALGGTLYHLVTGQLPFPGSNPFEVVEKKQIGVFVPASTVHPGVPTVLDKILAKMMAPGPAERYQTASELVVALERSNLAVSMPTFADPEAAAQEPGGQPRPAEPPQPTRLDFAIPAQQPAAESASADLWYLRYRDRDGQWCKARATTQQILHRLKEGRLPRTIVASRHSKGPFFPLTAYGEFPARSLAAVQGKRAIRRGPPPAVARGQVAAEPAPAGRKRIWLISLGLFLFGALAGSYAILFMR